MNPQEEILALTRELNDAGYRYAEHALQRFHNVVLEERRRVAHVYPVVAVYLAERRAESLGLALTVDEAFELRDFKVLAVAGFRRSYGQLADAAG